MLSALRSSRSARPTAPAIRPAKRSNISAYMLSIALSSARNSAWPVSSAAGSPLCGSGRASDATGFIIALHHRRLRDLRQLRERRRVAHREIGEQLAVHVDVGL